MAQSKKVTRRNMGQNKGGRPKLDPSVRKNKVIKVFATAAEESIVVQAARLDGLTPSQWLLRLGLQEALRGDEEEE